MSSYLGYSYITPVGVTNVKPAFIQDTLSLKRFIVETGVQRFEYQITFVGGKNDDLYGKFAADHMMKGAGTAFNINTPQFIQVEDKVEGNIIRLDLQAGDSEGATELMIDSTEDFFIPAGFIFTWDNHTKNYMCTEDCDPTYNEDTSRYEATLKFGPGIIKLPVDNAQLNTSNIVSRVEYQDNTMSFTTNDGVYQKLTINFIEKLV